MGKLVSFFCIVFIQSLIIQASVQEISSESKQTRSKVVEDILSDRAEIFSREEQKKIRAIIVANSFTRGKNHNLKKGNNFIAFFKRRVLSH